MGPGQAIGTCLRKSFTYSGRASRSEFWWFVLAVLLIGSAVSILEMALFQPHQTATLQGSMSLPGGGSGTFQAYSGSFHGGPVSQVFWLAALIPLVAAGWRRLHDIGRPGWQVLLPAAVTFAGGAILGIVLLGGPFFAFPGLPFLGGLPAGLIMLIYWVACVGLHVALLVWLSRGSAPSSNSYGPNPLEVTP